MSIDCNVLSKICILYVFIQISTKQVYNDSEMNLSHSIKWCEILIEVSYFASPKASLIILALLTTCIACKNNSIMAIIQAHLIKILSVYKTLKHVETTVYTLLVNFLPSTSHKDCYRKISRAHLRRRLQMASSKLGLHFVYDF